VIGIVDYGLGNIKAIQNIYRTLGINVKIASSSEDLNNVQKIILPGVGAFDWALQKLNGSGMLNNLNRRVLVDKVPVLGICVGMQIMCKSSEEGSMNGLGWLNADVKSIEPKVQDQQVTIPHMGWNDVYVKKECLLFFKITNANFYFLHSYYVSPNTETDIVATSIYPNEFACCVSNANIYATQFHPEKSHFNGVKLLENFATLC
jgi:imidazole glycerol-phosphate synthase subunit HisH